MVGLTNENRERIRRHFPEENILEGRPGRKPISSRKVLEAAPICNTGAQWRMLPKSYPNHKTVHRRFQLWYGDGTLRNVLTGLANTLHEEGGIDESECFVDAMFSSAKGGGERAGPTKRGMGVKIPSIFARHWLPISVSTHAANHHEVILARLSFAFYVIETTPANLIGYRAYDTDRLD